MATAEKVVLKRAAVLALIEFCGWKAATRWDNGRLATKLKQIPDVYPPGSDEPEDPGVAETLGIVLEAIQDGAAFDVVDDDEAADEKPKAKKDKPEPKAKKAAKPKKVEVVAEDEEEEEEEEEEAPKPAKKAKKAKPVEVADEEEEETPPPKKPKAKKAAAVEPEEVEDADDEEAPKPAKKAKKVKKAKKESRGYYAGYVVADHGGADCEGITDEMIGEVDALYGRPNPNVSKGALGWALSALRGAKQHAAGKGI